MKRIVMLILIPLLLVSCQTKTKQTEKPHIAFSFDDGSTNNILSYDNADWNSMIRKQLKDVVIKSVTISRGGFRGNFRQLLK